MSPQSAPPRAPTSPLHLNEEGQQYANSWRLREIVKKYSNHIAFPIFLTYDKSEWNEEEKKSIKSRTTEQVNAASALWRRSKSELKDEDYKELYKSITGEWEDPLFWFHTKAEGSLEYTTLFYVPAKAPLDLYQAEYKTGVKLYVKRVFIMDDAKELLPSYLRFVRGIIDSEDLPLNVSREILQQNRILTSIRTASVKKILSELKNIAATQPELYLKFICEYNRPLKEGLYGDYANRETLLDLVRFKSTKVDGLTKPGRGNLAHARRTEEHLLHHWRHGFPAPHIASARDIQRRRISRFSSSTTRSMRLFSPALINMAISSSSRSIKHPRAKT